MGYLSNTDFLGHYSGERTRTVFFHSFLVTLCKSVFVFTHLFIITEDSSERLTWACQTPPKLHVPDSVFLLFFFIQQSHLRHDPSSQSSLAAFFEPLSPLSLLGKTPKANEETALLDKNNRAIILKNYLLFNNNKKVHKAVYTELFTCPASQPQTLSGRDLITVSGSGP